LDLAGGTLLIIRRLIVPLALGVMAYAGEGFAQGAFQPMNGAASSSFPAGGTAPIADSVFPSQAGPSDECTKQFAPLREEAVQRGALIKAAGERRAPAEEACKLIGSYGQAEIRMIKYVEANASSCGIPQQISDHLKQTHEHTESMQQKICAMVQQERRGPAGPLGDYWLPEEQL
jgi:hypothetical protein